MTARICLTGLLALACLGAVGIMAQHRQLGALKEQKGQILAQLSGPLDAQSASMSSDQESGKSETAVRGSAADSSELLQLRSQMVRLTDRKRELMDARAENERLQAQLAARRTNSAGEKPLPPDYIRKSSAQWAGLGTPENALRSFLWALQSRDETNLLRVVTPESGAQLIQKLSNSPDKMFEESYGIPGLRILRQRVLPDGSIELDVEMIPGTPAPHPLHLRPIDGEWKLDIF